MAIIRSIKGKKHKKHLLRDVRGMIGNNVVVRQYKDKIVISNKPAKSRKKPTASQKSKRERFKRAVAHAKMVLNNPALSASYQHNLKGKRNVFQAALSDYLNSNQSY